VAQANGIYPGEEQGNRRASNTSPATIRKQQQHFRISWSWTC